MVVMNQVVYVLILLDTISVVIFDHRKVLATIKAGVLEQSLQAIMNHIPRMGQMATTLVPLNH